MLNNPHNESGRRPVDALFGDNAASPGPSYIVEPPQPATPITPPIEPAALSPFEVADAHSGDAPATLASEPPPMIEATFAPEPARFDDARFLTLSFQVERLYDDVKAELRDSPKATQYCFDLLLRARQAYEQHDYARAEFFIQTTDAKLKRSAKSVQASSSPVMFVLWAWQFGALFLGGAIIAVSYIAGLTLFGLPIASEFIVLIRVLGWGMLGGVIGAMYNLPRFVQQREYDPAYTMHYFARPLVGLLLGAMLFVISQAGILAGNIVIGDFKAGPLFLYVFALLAGFKQESVGDFFENLVKAIFGRQSPK